MVHQIKSKIKKYSLCALVFVSLNFNTAIAGVDFSMTSVYKVPFFHSKDEAWEYANKVKWNDEILESFLTRYEQTKEMIDQGHEYPSGDFYANQLSYLELAINIMQEYKRNHVGSTIYAGEIPCYKGVC